VTHNGYPLLRGRGLTTLRVEVENMGCGAMKVACEDGFEVVTKDQKELVALTQWHVQHAHHKAVTEHEVMAMSKHP
jgi:hypothetical protein